jgi:hypothetical protein
MKHSLRQSAAIILILAFVLPALANVEGDQVMYVGGSNPNVKPGIIGRLDTSQEAFLTYTFDGGRVVIPYAKFVSWEYTEKLARHYGVVGTIAVTLIKYRQRRHYFRINYRDDASVEQVVIFEVPKTMPQVVKAVLEVRAPNPKPERPYYDKSCGCIRGLQGRPGQSVPMTPEMMNAVRQAIAQAGPGSGLVAIRLDSPLEAGVQLDTALPSRSRYTKEQQQMLAQLADFHPAPVNALAKR